MKGTVKFFNPMRGFGFIIGDDDHAEYFVPYSEIRMPGYRELYEAERVEFDPAEDSKQRRRAENVTLLEKRAENPKPFRQPFKEKIIKMKQD